MQVGEAVGLGVGLKIGIGVGLPPPPPPTSAAALVTLFSITDEELCADYRLTLTSAGPAMITRLPISGTFCELTPVLKSVRVAVRTSVLPAIFVPPN